MPTARVTSKGQVTIPKEIRERMGIHAGDQLRFTLREDGSVVVDTKKGDLRDLRGAVQPEVRGVSIDEMGEAIRRRGSDR